ncbi:MAG: glycosyl hydrolase [Flavobacteriales bacterium]
MNQMLPFLWSVLLSLVLFSAAAQTPVSLLDDVPLNTEAPSFLPISNEQSPSARWESTNAPLPTNVWWQNFSLNAGTGIANALPYIVKSSTNGLSGCMPWKTTGQTYVISTFVNNWTMGATQTLAAHKIIDYDPLSVTLRWNGAGGNMRAPIVRGMPYLTTIYEGLTPELNTIHAIMSINGTSPNATITDDRFEIALNNGQTWVLYASESIALTFTGNNSLTGPTNWNGTLRLAIVGGNGVSTDATLLDAHSDAYPAGGSVVATATGDVAELVFQWEWASMSGGTATTGLQCALPHHEPVLQEAVQVGTGYPTIKGDMRLVNAEAWHMTEALTTIGFESPEGIAPSLEQEVRDALAENVNWPITAGDTYFGGKQLAAVGRLAVIADELNETALAASYRTTLGNALHPWLNGTNSDALRYDEDWGGVISSSGGSFGQGLYNDHHFHYGYFLYAAAAMAKNNPAWANQWGDEVMHLVRNLANPAPSDPYYTYLRNKDWFVGHSWASGLYEFGDGRNQESTSEAVNAWYSLYLYGLAIGDERIRDLGRLMLATEIRSTQRYWQVDSSDGIYDEPYASNKVVGVLWSTKVDYGTFFGGNTEFIHCIQMLPFTPISETLLEPAWIEEEYPVLVTALDNPAIGQGWRGFVYMAHAVIDPVAAWYECQTLTGYDDGNTKTNTLYWLATRPGMEELMEGYEGGGGGETGVEGVRFQVDMSQETIQGTIFLTGGSIDGWCGTCVPMSDPEGDGIYEVTLDLAPGPVEYKFVNGSWTYGETFDPVADAVCTLTTGEFTNRYFVVPASGNADIGVVCFNSCDACEGGVDCASDTNNNGICDEDDIAGCTYPLAPNYDPLATMDDGTCEWSTTEPDCVGDLNGDNQITVGDLLMLLGVFGGGC